MRETKWKCGSKVSQYMFKKESEHIYKLEAFDTAEEFRNDWYNDWIVFNLDFVCWMLVMNVWYKKKKIDENLGKASKYLHLKENWPYGTIPFYFIV